jgi:hypothetical protein
MAVAVVFASILLCMVTHPVGVLFVVVLVNVRVGWLRGAAMPSPYGTARAAVATRTKIPSS